LTDFVVHIEVAKMQARHERVVLKSDRRLPIEVAGGVMRSRIKRLIAYINRKDWWHVPPRDARSYDKRGKFLAWSFRQAEHYGRPLDQPEKVLIQFPLIGDEPTIERALFGRELKKNWPDDSMMEHRLALDGKMKRAGLRKGYDSIVLMSRPGFAAFRTRGKISRSIELNILRPVTFALPSAASALRPKKARPGA
jgi:hypothetical protein